MSSSILARGMGEWGGQSLKEAPGKKSKLRSKEVKESNMSPLGGARQRETIDTGCRQGAGGIGTEMAGDHAGPRAQASDIVLIGLIIMRGKLFQMLYWSHERALGIIFSLGAFMLLYYKLINHCGY